VYAFDQSYRQVWKRRLGSPSPAQERQCGDIDPLIWVLDPNAGALHVLDPSTGKSLGQVSVGAANRFATPALCGADVIVPTLAGIAVVRTS
jgi:hypothetical protein